MFKLKITDELGFNYYYEFNNIKSLKKELNNWLNNIDSTPLYNIEIDIS
jgi:hypothetical protein